MENVIRVLAKEVRRLRAVVEIAEKCRSSLYLFTKRNELDVTRRILAMLIKGVM